MNQKGFPFIEIIMTLLLLAGGVVGIFALYQQNVARSGENEQFVTATLLAQEKLETMIHNKKFSGYDSISSANYPTTEDLTAEGFNNYTRITTIAEVREDDLETPQNGSGYKKITVSVSIPGGFTIPLQTLLTDWGEIE